MMIPSSSPAGRAFRLVAFAAVVWLVLAPLARGLVDALLEEHRVQKDEISHWIIHSGGRKVIDTIQRDLGLTDIQVRHSRHVLKQFGNMSSPTVLFVLQEALRNANGNAQPKDGDLGVMLALGPGLAVEAALLAW